VVVIHGGAGSRSRALREDEGRWLQTLHRALEEARAVLLAGGAAIDGAQAAVALMEDHADHLNAGRGSTLCADGTVEMSAALMRGSDLAAGAVAGLRHTRSPVAAARLVLESEQVLMVGNNADQLAAAGGIEQMEPAYFVTEHQLARLSGAGTVGAVCLDADGCLAAATSTGGVRGQPPGRVGDTPLVGAGTWADREVAVSCTGDGEAFIRAGVARLLAALVQAGGGVEQAALAALEQVSALGGSGGLIALGAGGEVAAPFLTETMPRGVWRAGAGLEVAI
jgi:beta-aspartyl-peptidase (threonine type)